MHPPLGIDRHPVGVGKNHPRSANGGEGPAVPHHAGADRRRRVVPRAADHDGPFRQAGELRRPAGELPGHLRRLVHLPRQGAVNLQLVQHFVRPAAVRDVQKLHPRRVGYLRRQLAREHIPDVVLGQEDVPALFVYFRLMVADPEDLGRGEAGQRRVGRNRNQPVVSQALGDLLALGGGALIAPDDGAAEHLAPFVQHHQAVHLPGEADARNGAGRHAAFRQHRADPFHRRVPPVGRFLLGIAVLRLIQRVLRGMGGHHRPRLVKQRGLGAGGADVDAHQIRHCFPCLSGALRPSVQRLPRSIRWGRSRLSNKPDIRRSRLAFIIPRRGGLSRKGRRPQEPLR